MFGNQTAREAARGARLEQLEKWRAEELKERQAKLAANGGIPSTTNASKSRRAEENLEDPTKPRFSVDLTLFMAVRDRDVALATRLLKKGANVKAINTYGHTPLHVAVTNDDRTMIEFLINNGSDIEARDQDGWTPLHAAAHWGSNKAVQILVDEGANLIAVNSDNETPLEVGEFADTCELLRNIMEAEGITQEMVDDAKMYESRRMLQDFADGEIGNIGEALHVAASKGYKEIAAAILRSPNVDIEVRDSNYWTPLHTACFWDSHEVIIQLVEAGADLTAKTRNEETPYDLAVDKTTRQLIRDLKKRNRRVGGVTVKGGKYGSKRYSAPHKQRGQLEMSQVDAAKESEKSRRASSPFLSAVDFTSEQLERLRLLPENVWNEIEAMESGLGPKGGLMGMKGCSTVFFFAVIAFIFLLGAVGGLVGLYFAAGSPCLPGEACNVPPSDVNVCDSFTTCTTCTPDRGCVWCTASNVTMPNLGLCMPGTADGPATTDGTVCNLPSYFGTCIACTAYEFSQCLMETQTINIIWIVCIAVGGIALLSIVIGIPIAVHRVKQNSKSPLGLFDPEEMNEIRSSAANSGMASLKRKASNQQLLVPNDAGGSLVRRASMSKSKAASGEAPRKGERPANADRKHSESADKILRTRENLIQSLAAESSGGETVEGAGIGDVGAVPAAVSGSSNNNGAAGGSEQQPLAPAPAPVPAPAPAAEDTGSGDNDDSAPAPANGAAEEVRSADNMSVVSQISDVMND